ncbi:hypothetical protein BKA67DRAFT_571021 [Truncatella angustata]|uniref:DUF1993 domain-containing protein n=1 Tax=Truncatella angustata TaxID=152316 RepID=A0A9P8ZVV3_9PEZI|nr:uncharacterized protein BKA67DRAFT_571021 [Truncatella angustata]KAH6651467.1 hypothetical protein BKA67DRAFT_571021 [Truncatella angustata]KAH8203766.1 hypothetical protein TruAng_002059 [Truncatella angustata]
MASLYKQSVPVFTKYLHNLSAIVKKGETFANEKSIKHDEILNYRLISDMKGLIYQVQSCCDTAVWYVDRVGGLKHVAVEDNETTFDQLYQRIERTIAYLDEVEPRALDDKADAKVLMETKSMGNFQFTGQAYLSEFSIPNFHFHLSTAYCILRTQGVQIGALDYLKDVFHKV